MSELRRRIREIATQTIVVDVDADLSDLTCGRVLLKPLEQEDVGVAGLYVQLDSAIGVAFVFPVDGGEVSLRQPILGLISATTQASSSSKTPSL